MVDRRRDVVLLGSTGSVGARAVDVARRHPERFRVVGLAARGGNLSLLARQALTLGVDVVGVADPGAAEAFPAVLEVEARLLGIARADIRCRTLLGGDSVPADLAAWPSEVVLNAITGFAGITGTVAALAAGRTVALANTESLVAGGPLLAGLARPGQIVPVDASHSAIAQCIRAGRPEEVRRLVITAGGGPFHGRTRAQLDTATPGEAVAHRPPTTDPVLAVNAATLVGAGLAVMEAHLLFDIALERIDVVVHPQSAARSVIEFVDGATVVQAGYPDMRLPISLGLSWPDRLPDAAPGLDWRTAQQWTFEPLDEDAFPAVRLARHAARMGGCIPAVYNAANDVCVSAFLAGRLPFPAIAETIATVVSEHREARRSPRGVADLVAADAVARARALAAVRRHQPHHAAEGAA
jgi:1-deoxy-D-xylulose-5-phosphate reductoisomerase